MHEEAQGPVCTEKPPPLTAISAVPIASTTPQDDGKYGEGGLSGDWQETWNATLKKAAGGKKRKPFTLAMRKGPQGIKLCGASSACVSLGKP